MTLRQQTCGLVEQNMLIFHGALVKIICFFSQMILLNLDFWQVQSIWMVTFSCSGERSGPTSFLLYYPWCCAFSGRTARTLRFISTADVITFCFVFFFDLVEFGFVSCAVGSLGIIDPLSFTLSGATSFCALHSLSLLPQPSALASTLTRPGRLRSSSSPRPD